MSDFNRPRFSQEQHDAFHAAVKQLFAEWPLQDDQDREHSRALFLHRTKVGLWATRPDWIPIGWLGVPSDQLFAIHVLVYG